jgi:hypothetical protein
VTAPKPNVAESDSCAMLPTLATIIIASAGQTIVPAETPGAAGTAGTAPEASFRAICGLFPSGCGARRYPVVVVGSMSATRSSYVDSSSGQ